MAGGGEEGLAPIHEQEELEFLSPTLEIIKGDRCLVGDPCEGGLTQVRLHQGSAVLARSHGYIAAAELMRSRRVDILL